MSNPPAAPVKKPSFWREKRFSLLGAVGLLLGVNLVAGLVNAAANISRTGERQLRLVVRENGMAQATIRDYTPAGAVTQNFIVSPAGQLISVQHDGIVNGNDPNSQEMSLDVKIARDGTLSLRDAGGDISTGYEQETIKAVLQNGKPAVISLPSPDGSNFHFVISRNAFTATTDQLEPLRPTVPERPPSFDEGRLFQANWSPGKFMLSPRA